MSPLERPSSISDLAPELIAHILSILLEESRPTLLDCALVCRYWLATTRVLLFTEVNLKNHRDMRYFASVISTSPMIKSYIKVIRIDKRRFAAWTSTSVTEAFCDLFTVPGLLPNLRKLYLGNVYETWTMAAFEKLSRLSTVTSLIVDKCSMSKAELLMLLSSFGSLQECFVRHLDISRHQTNIPLPVLACRSPLHL
ncbi:hypothetical protein C8Q75DRAFT_180657 [Abortiporus biennis]|nr:hypothetical protein C8Q75DRAFT_180657 [Abortiporus biennis]